MLRTRIAALGPGDEDRTVFANRAGGPLSPFNVRRTFRDFLALAGLAVTGISLRWYRRTGATVIARAADVDTAAAFLGHASSAITEGHYIEPTRSVDHAPATFLQRALRPGPPDPAISRVLATPLEATTLEALTGADGP